MQWDGVGGGGGLAGVLAQPSPLLRAGLWQSWCPSAGLSGGQNVGFGVRFLHRCCKAVGEEGAGWWVVPWVPPTRCPQHSSYLSQ